MGYQVGATCYATKQEAENVYFSLVAPVATISTQNTVTTSLYPSPISMPTRANKVNLISPEYRNGKWYLQGTLLDAKLPYCEPAKNFRDGAELGWLVFAVMASCYVFLIIKKLL